MRFLILASLCTFSNISAADFNQAADDYANKNHQTAFNEFHRLAKLGNKRAQFNLGVMYLHGEYVNQNLTKAYAWGKLSEHQARPEFSDISQSLAAQFNDKELQMAKAAYHRLNENYGDEQIYKNHSPIVYQADLNHKNKTKQYIIKPIKRKAPRYPKEAYANRTQGWVTLGFEVYPDGTVRNPYVIDTYPKNTFENSTIEAVTKFKFEVSFEPGVEPYTLNAHQTIQYSLENLADPKQLREIYARKLDQLSALASQGSAQAQYQYAIAASSNLINKDNIMPTEEVNQWLLKSAQNGHIEAQYHLGKNILRGKGCKVEKQKGIDWIVYAAEQGHPRSSRMAYSLLTKHNNLNKTEKPAEFWLKQAAKNGDADSQIEYAEFLSNQENPSLNDLLLAREYLEKQADQRDKSVTWYQVSADIYSHQGEEKKAKKHQKKADKMAKKLGWEI